MNNYEIKNFLDPRRHILAFAAGIIGAFLPNDKSNSTPLINGAIFAALVVKVLYGDYDEGYSWTLSDILFWITNVIEGMLAAYLITSVGMNSSKHVLDKK